MHRTRSLTSLMLIFLVVPWASAMAQSPGTESTRTALGLTVEAREQVLSLLLLDCGTSGELARFDTALGAILEDVSPLLLQVVREGTPDSLLRASEDSAKRSWQERQAWLKEDGKTLFDAETTSRLQQTTLESYLAETSARMDLRVRGNAIRGLERVGDARALRLLEEVSQQEALAILANSAIEAIKERTR